MNEILVTGREERIPYEQGQCLMEILLKAGVFINNPCNGKGICGKCKVRVLAGYDEPLSQAEEHLLDKEEQERRIRLSCFLIPKGTVTIELLQEEKNHQILTKGMIPTFPYAPEVKETSLTVKKPALREQTPLEEQIIRQLGVEKLGTSVLRRVSGKEGNFKAVMHREELLALKPKSDAEGIYGVAIDIGTTTVAAALVNLNTGKELADVAMINAQKHYGLDVLTRITYEIEYPEDGADLLKKAIVRSLDKEIVRMCGKTGISPSSVYEITISANCTMLHMLLGVDAVSIGVAPFAPVFTQSRYLKAAEAGFCSAENAVLYLLPSVSAYIGADIVAGAYVCGLKSKKNVLFIDIGTNGEIVLAGNNRLLSCSCAAGPALEGMNIRSGMRAVEGAVEDVELREKGISLSVIGGGEPQGFCGSGILAVIREFVKIGLIEKNGALIKPEKLDPQDWRKSLLRIKGKKREVVLAPNLIVTQSDIRQVQLAKGAILSGFYALLNQAGLAMSDLDEVVVAGQFGMHLPVESLVGTGILPEEVKECITYIGNSSKAGAYMALMSGSVKREMEKLAQEIQYIELSASPGYERLFSQCLQFPTIF